MNWSFYDLATGRLIGKRLHGGDKEFAQANAPIGCAPLAGAHDWKTKRVDLATLEVVDGAVTQPQAERDILDRVEAQFAIRAIEQTSGPRAVREALLLVLPVGPERDRLKSSDDSIAQLRPLLSAKVVPTVVDDAKSGVVADGEVLKGSP